MFSLLKTSIQSIVWIALSVAAPATAMRRAESSRQRGSVCGIHGVAMLLVLACLVALQQTFQLDAFVRSSLPFVRWAWLPIVGTLFYAMAWSAWFVAKTLQMKSDQPLQSTLATSLQKGLDQCVRAGIDIQNTPIYLIIGAPDAGIRSFFHASHTELSVLPAPEEADDPVQVCGNRNAIFVCCRNASLMGDFSRRAAANRQRQIHTAGNRQSSVDYEPAYVWTKSSSPQRSLHAQDGGVALAVQAETAVQTTATCERVEQTLAELDTMVEAEVVGNQILQPSHAIQPILRLEQARATELLHNLDGLCRELAHLRQPYCPINGVLILVPLDATDCIETADHVGMRIQRDLITIAEATETSVSSQVIFCDLELCEGSQPFLERFPETQRDRRLGAVLPTPPESEPDAGPNGIDRAVQWICSELFPPLGYRLMARDIQRDDHDRELRQGNHAIHRLVDAMRQRREGMSRMLRRAVSSTEGNVRLRGCFVAATGMAGAGKQAFAQGVVPLLLDLQNEVQWSRLRRSRDRWQRRAAMLTYATVVCAACVTTALLLGWHS